MLTMYQAIIQTDSTEYSVASSKRYLSQPVYQNGFTVHKSHNVNVPRDKCESTAHAVEDMTMGLRDLVPSISNSLSTVLLLLMG